MTPTAGWTGAIRPCAARSISAARPRGSRSPILFNVPYAIFGHFALWIWMLTAVSISLAGAVFGGRIAYQADGADGAASLRGLDRPAVFGGRLRARDRGLLPLRAERPVGLDARDRLPGRDRLLPEPPPPLGVVARRARLAGPPRGVAVRRPVRRSGCSSRSRRCAGCSSSACCRQRLPVVRRADDHQRPPEHRRPARAQVAARMHHRQDHLHLVSRYTALDYLPVELGGAARVWCSPAAAQLDRAGARRRWRSAGWSSRSRSRCTASPACRATCSSPRG